MNYSIELTMRAKEDLKQIFEYIAVDLQSTQNATSQLKRLENAINSLEQMPERFRIYDKVKWSKQNLRVMPVDNYLVFYIPNRSERKVTILRVMYGKMDINEQLDNISFEGKD